MREIDEEDKADLAAFPFHEEAEFRALGGAQPVGEKGFTTLERRYFLCFCVVLVEVYSYSTDHPKHVFVHCLHAEISLLAPPFGHFVTM